MAKSTRVTIPTPEPARAPFRFDLPADLVREAKIQMAMHCYKSKNQFMEEAVRNLVKTLKAAA